MIRIVIALAIALATSPAVAQTPADNLAKQADALAQAGDFRGAAEKFAEAYRADPTRHELFCNVGISLYKARELPRAHLLLGRCIERTALDPKFVDAARTVLVSVEATLRAGGHVPITVAVSPSTTSIVIVEFGPDEAFVGTRVVWLPHGTFHFTARSEGFVEQTVTVVAGPNAPTTTTITMQRTPVTNRLPVAEPEKPRFRRESGSKVPAIGATAGTAVMITLAIVASSKAGSAANRADAALDANTFADDKSTMDRWNTTFAITSSLAVVGAGVSGYLWFRAVRGRTVPIRGSWYVAEPPPAIQPAIQIDAHGARVSLSGRF